MKKYVKIIIINLIIISILNIISIHVQANTPDDIIDGAQGFLNSKESSTGTIDGEKLKVASDTIYNLLLVVATILAVLVGAIIGIQFMIASAENKAKVKEALLPFIIGCVIVFGSFGIWKLVVTVGKSLDNSSTISTGLKKS